LVEVGGWRKRERRRKRDKGKRLRRKEKGLVVRGMGQRARREPNGSFR
jgi:hypothetical protein